MMVSNLVAVEGGHVPLVSSGWELGFVKAPNNQVKVGLSRFYLGSRVWKFRRNDDQWAMFALRNGNVLFQAVGPKDWVDSCFESPEFWDTLRNEMVISPSRMVFSVFP
jgi:hypothetical protein